MKTFINNSHSCKSELDLYDCFLNLLQSSNSKSYDHKHETSNPLILSETL